MSKEQLEKRAKLLADARALADKHIAENTFNQEAQNQVRTMMLEVKNLGASGQVIGELEEEERALASIREKPAAGSVILKPGGGEDRSRALVNPVGGQLRGGTIVKPGARNQLRSWDNEAYGQEFERHILTGRHNQESNEVRSMVSDLGASGGFLVTPMVLLNQFLQAVDDQLVLRGLATVIPMPKAARLGVPEMGDDASDPDWTTEIGQVQEGTDLSFKRREMEPSPISKLYKLSRDLIRNSNLDIQGFLMQRLARKFALAGENAFMTGNGVNKPLGLFFASENGIPTTRDSATGNTSSALTFNGLINAKYALKNQYRANAKWLFHTDAILQLALIKDLQDHYIWQPSVLENTPDRLLGISVVESRFAPNTFTTGQYVGLLGDFSYYWIAEALDVQLQVLLEKYAETNQNGYIMRAAFDGQPVMAEAFTRLKLG